MRTTLTLRSRNGKTGPIPVSTTSADTCPPSCPFLKSGCYADAGPLALLWRDVNAGTKGMQWDAFCRTVAALPTGQLWRHNQAGDLPGHGDAIDAAQLVQLAAANTGRRGFTFTHKPVVGHPDNAAAIQAANAAGFTVNLSANTLAHADELAALAIAPVAVVLPHDVDGSTTRTLQTPAGRTVSVCPATYREDVTCQSCQLCQRQDRTCIVGFPAHGNARRKASLIASRSLPDVSSRYGAPMGRVERHDSSATAPKFTLQRVRINSGGYDAGGAYWGLGQPLYWYSDENGDITAYLRAPTREAAKAKIREAYPDARFFR